MASLMEFPSFAELPAELRILIWEISILEHYHDRLVPMNPSTNTITCIPNLANSSHFRATWESRQVAIGLYPIRLRVLRAISPGYPVLETGTNNYQSHGAVHISTDYDIFLLNFETLEDCYYYYFIDLIVMESPLDMFEAFMWNSQRLSVLQCRRIRRIMVFHETREPETEDEAKAEAIRRLAGLVLPIFRFDIAVYSGVEKCLYVVPDSSIASIQDLYLDVLEATGRSIVEALEQSGWLTTLD